MNETIAKVLKYLLFGIIAVPLTIIPHELGHFLAYHLFGATNVQLHSASVSADKETLSNIQIAIANVIGPIISYLTIVLAFILTQKNYQPFWIILALAAPLGRIVNFVYIYFRLAGYSPNPNFDEFNFSKNLGIEPLFLAILTAILVIVTFAIFFKKAWSAGKFGEVGLVVFSLIVGVAIWFSVGGLILP